MDDIVMAFQHAAGSQAFYRTILAARGVDPISVRTTEDFRARVPIIGKEDVFPRFTLPELCQGGAWQDMASAMFSSGSSGVFSYALTTTSDAIAQQQHLDEMLRIHLDADRIRPTLINALAMGVSFTSSFPVIATGVRSDIVLQAIRTLRDYAGQIVIVADPHFAKKVIDEGIEQDIVWEDSRVSLIVGGTWMSNSLMQYLKRAIQRPTDGANVIIGTMGLTELGLNLFFQLPDLIELRDGIQNRPELLRSLFGDQAGACPALMYYMPDRLHVEVPSPDQNGFGDVVVSHLDTSLKTMLIRYNTADHGKIVDPGLLAHLLEPDACDCFPKLPLPIVAIHGRSSEFLRDGHVSTSTVMEALYRDPEIARQITGHFRMRHDGHAARVEVHLKPLVTPAERVECALAATLFDLSGQPIAVQCVRYDAFPHDFELSYERKWCHT